MKDVRPGGSTLQSADSEPSTSTAGHAAAAPGKQTLTAGYAATLDDGFKAKQAQVYTAAMALMRKMTAPGAEHQALESTGRAAGLGLGILVTEALRVLPDWNKPVLDAAGKPIQSAPGVTRIGDHDILKRHEEVVGPQIAKLVAKLSPGALHDIVQGLGDGATAAPGESYRLEVAASDMLHRK